MGKKRRIRQQQQQEQNKKNNDGMAPALNSRNSANNIHRNHHHTNSNESSSSPLANHTIPLSRRVCQLPLPFPAHLPVPSNGFLRNEPPYQESFQMALQTAYEGLEVDLTLPTPLPESTSSSSHNNNHHHQKITINESTVQQALHDMEATGFFRTDVTQPFGLGTKCAKTYVTRCLVGEPGTTYKYLGLRMFAFSWDKSVEEEDNDTKNHDTTARPLKVIYQLKQVLRERTRLYLKELQQRRQQRSASSSSSTIISMGRDEFDICLINRMEYSPALKLEPTLLQHRTAVSWHADSSLEHYSTIAVYQTLVPMATTATTATANNKAYSETAKKKRIKSEQALPAKSDGTTDHATATSSKGGGWTVALRVSPHAEGPDASNQRDDGKKKDDDEDDDEKGDAKANQSIAPPIAVSLPSGSAYYLLDDFNHHHQHAVLTEDAEPTEPTVRFSCTYRLLRTSHNVDYLLERGLRACRNFHKKGIKIWRSEQLLLTEMESDWIRQFYIQGQEHHNLLWKDWKEPVQGLLRYWGQLEARTKQTMDLLCSAAAGRCQSEATAVATTVESNRSERKLREKRKKAYQTLQELLSRSDSASPEVSADQNDHQNALQLLYEPFALLLEERANMRELWAQREKEYVFQELAPEFRPLQLPLEFGVVDASSVSTAEVGDERGKSPLKGAPRDLRSYATMLRACGQAYDSGRIDDLPNIELVQPKSRVVDDDDKNRHTKPIDWNGWSQQHPFALEMQSPWASLLLEGKKTIETRAYTLPSALLGKKIWILQSPKGADGVSATPNLIDLSSKTSDHDNGQEHDTVRVVGWCEFSSVKTYTKKKAFAKDESAHLVSSDSGYGWVQGKTQVLYGWVVNEYGTCDQDDVRRFSSATRRMRSLFELHAVGGGHNGQAAPSKSSPKKTRHQASTERNQKKRKRF